MKAKDAVFRVWLGMNGEPGKVQIVTLETHRARGRPEGCFGEIGAVGHQWRSLTPARLKECLLWVSLELTDHYNVPIKDVMKEMEKIDEFIEHWNVVGRRTGTLF